MRPLIRTGVSLDEQRRQENKQSRILRLNQVRLQARQQSRVRQQEFGLARRSALDDLATELKVPTGGSLCLEDLDLKAEQLYENLRSSSRVFGLGHASAHAYTEKPERKHLVETLSIQKSNAAARDRVAQKKPRWTKDPEANFQHFKALGVRDAESKLSRERALWFRENPSRAASNFEFIAPNPIAKARSTTSHDLFETTNFHRSVAVSRLEPTTAVHTRPNAARAAEAAADETAHRLRQKEQLTEMHHANAQIRSSKAFEANAMEKRKEKLLSSLADLRVQDKRRKHKSSLALASARPAGFVTAGPGYLKETFSQKFSAGGIELAPTSSANIGKRGYTEQLDSPAVSIIFSP
ncbi:hypothetical protein DFJ73DRAFT_825803 [Zopfochytrium polystomum]|nr:hypothetical protein DFJ73DRAFT_825803 [Zopfochytrium polystomum]